MKKLTKDKFLKIIENNSKCNPFCIDLYDKKSVISCRNSVNDHFNFFVKFTCRKCNKRVIKNISRKNKNNIQFITYCAVCLRKSTCLDKYGVDSFTKTKKYLQKTKQTNLKKYGTEWSLQNKSIRNKCKQTIQNKYGVDNVSQSDIIKKKKRETTIKHYGVDNPSKSDKVKTKRINTTRKRYKKDYYSQTEECKNRTKETCKERYGVEYALQAKEIRNKIKNTLIDKYGVDAYAKTDEFKEKFKNTCIERYGVDNPNKSDIVKEKKKEIFLEKYGCETPFQDESVKDKIKQTLIEKYGVHNSFLLVSKYSYDNERFDSSWELAFYIYHKDKGHSIIRTSKTFAYAYNKKIHCYTPDFKIGNRYYEIKGEQFLVRYKNGNIKGMKCPFDKSLNNLYNAKYKCMIKHNVIIIDYNRIQKYLKYVVKEYGLNYLSTFKVVKNH